MTTKGNFSVATSEMFVLMTLQQFLVVQSPGKTFQKSF